MTGAGDVPGPVRTLVLWCPDWPVVAAGLAEGVPAHRPAAVFAGNRVVAASAVARTAGVRRGLRRRDAQGKCPELVVFGHEPERDARFFEAVVLAVEELVVGVEVVRPGVVAMAARGAAGYFGGEERLAELLVDKVSNRTGVECQVGIAEGLFAATLAAHRSRLVEPGRTGEFLAPLSIRELDQPDTDRGELVGLLRRLGLGTLGAFAGLTAREVSTRFGPAGTSAQRLAAGQAARPPLRRRPPPELTVSKTFEPPLERVDVAAFMGKTLATAFQAGLAAGGLACTRLGIHAETESGERYTRSWRCAEPLDEAGVADRVRWQFEGWLKAPPDGRPASGVVRLRLVPEETVEGRSLQLGLWRGGAAGEAGGDGDFAGLGTEQVLLDERAGRAMVHVQGLLGPEAVRTPVLGGGRGPVDQVRLVPWGDRRVPRAAPEANWTGRLPMPATVLTRRVPVRVLDFGGRDLWLDDRGELSGRPEVMMLGRSAPRLVRGWAGAWRFRSPGGPDRLRLQAVLTAGREHEPALAVLLAAAAPESPQWTIEWFLEGVYD